MKPLTYTTINELSVQDFPEHDVVYLAREIAQRRLAVLNAPALISPTTVHEYLQAIVGDLQHEEFHAVWMNNRHRPLAHERLFTGDIDSCTVFPRQVARSALEHMASAVLFFHNHPSQELEPSEADVAITLKLQDVLRLLDVRVLDHLIVSVKGFTSLREEGLL